MMIACPASGGREARKPLSIDTATYAYHPSARLSALRDRALLQPTELFADACLRPYYYLKGWRAARSASLALRSAAGLASVIRNMPVRMVAGELLVGEHGNTNDLINFRPFLGPQDVERLEASALTQQQKDNFAQWAREQPFAYQALAPVAEHPPELQLAQERGVVAVWGTDLNHSVRDYAKVLRLGFAGLRGEVEAALAALPLTDPDTACRRANLQAWLGICDAAMALGPRHAAEARRLASACDDPLQRAEWLAVAEVCDRVPTHPARTFREALQALWFAHMITVWEDGVNANSLGRLDQYLWPYLEDDLAEGRITWDQAAELLAALWVKLYQSYDVQQVTLGGCRPDGSDATNPLSYLALAVTEGLGFIRCLSARLHRDTPRAFVARCIDLVAQGGGIPFLFNDDTLIPALVSKGIPVEDARDYAPIGCIEITIPGRANPHAVSHWINLAKCLELALNDGCDMLDGTQIGPRTGSLADFGTPEDVLEAFRRQLRHFADLAVYGSNSAELAHRYQYRLPYLSLLTEDCIARGLDIIEGGARYNYHGSAAMGIPNVADSLTALQIAVFEEGLVARDEMLSLLRSDFAGREDLATYLRTRLPKYGNDRPLPDAYAAQITQEYCKLLGSYRTVGGGTFFCHLFTFTLMLGYGTKTAATPDGRRCGEPLAYSVSPVQGRDKEGVTALIKSLSRLPHHLAAGSSAAIVELHPSLLQNSGREAFVDLVRTAVGLGVGQMQFNVVSADTLRAAQEHPEIYRHLCVRVAGFSQQFVLLDQAMQDHIIARTKHWS